MTKSEALDNAIIWLGKPDDHTELDFDMMCAAMSQAWSAIAALLPDDDADTTSEGE